MDENALRSPSHATSGGRFFGIPDERLFGTWDLQGICEFLDLSERKVSDLMKAPGAPAPLRLGSERCKRWNRFQVVAWWHGDPDAAAGPTGRRLAAVPDAPSCAVPDAPYGRLPDAPPTAVKAAARAQVPGTPWRPKAAR